MGTPNHKQIIDAEILRRKNEIEAKKNQLKVIQLEIEELSNEITPSEDYLKCLLREISEFLDIEKFPKGGMILVRDKDSEYFNSQGPAIVVLSKVNISLTKAASAKLGQAVQVKALLTQPEYGMSNGFVEATVCGFTASNRFKLDRIDASAKTLLANLISSNSNEEYFNKVYFVNDVGAIDVFVDYKDINFAGLEYKEVLEVFGKHI